MKIYVPDLSYQCIYVYGEGVIRAYEETPQANRTIAYRDYYINSNYIYRDGTTSFSTYSNLPTCLQTSVLTNDFYYRNDITSILITFSILVLFCIYFPIKLFLRLIGGRH